MKSHTQYLGLPTLEMRYKNPIWWPDAMIWVMVLENSVSIAFMVSFQPLARGWVPHGIAYQPLIKIWHLQCYPLSLETRYCTPYHGQPSPDWGYTTTYGVISTLNTRSRASNIWGPYIHWLEVKYSLWWSLVHDQMYDTIYDMACYSLTWCPVHLMVSIKPLILGNISPIY